MTDRTPRATRHLGRLLQRVILPLLMFSGTIIGATSLQQAHVTGSPDGDLGAGEIG